MTDILWSLAGIEDAAMLCALFTRSFVETFGPLYAPENLAIFLDGQTEAKWQNELSDPRFAVWLGRSDGEAVAFVKVGPVALPVVPEGAALELKQFYVMKPWQGAGLAPDMMEWVLDQARERGAGEIFLSVFIDNMRARRFYERYGFEYVGDYAFMVGNQADHDLLMRLRLG